MTKKTFPSWLALLLIAGVASGAAYLVLGQGYLNETERLSVRPVSVDSKDMPDAAGWTEYRHEESGIRFLHPTDWLVPEDFISLDEYATTLSLYRQGDIADLRRRIEMQVGSESPYDFISLTVYHDDMGLAPLEWALANGKNEAYSNYHVGKLHTVVSVDGREGYQYEWLGLGGGRTTLVGYDGKIYGFSIFAIDGEVASDTELGRTYDGILSSIRFIKSGGEIDTSDWAEYQSTALGFSVHTPPGWQMHEVSREETVSEPGTGLLRTVEMVSVGFQSEADWQEQQRLCDEGETSYCGGDRHVTTFSASSHTDVIEEIRGYPGISSEAEVLIGSEQWNRYYTEGLQYQGDVVHDPNGGVVMFEPKGSDRAVLFSSSSRHEDLVRIILSTFSPIVITE